MCASTFKESMLSFCSVFKFTLSCVCVYLGVGTGM